MRLATSKISLRVRLFALTALALASLLIAMISAYRTAQMSTIYSERRAENDVQAAARELIRQSENIGGLPTDGRGNLPPHVREILRRYLDDYSRSTAIALNRLDEVSGGFCSKDGTAFGYIASEESFSNVSPQELCKSLTAVNDWQAKTMQLNGENFYVAYAPILDGKRAENIAGVFAFQHSPKSNFFSDRFNLVTQLFLLISAVALAIFAFTTFRRWQKGMRNIESGLQEISGDLSRRIELPQIAELARISLEINRLAENLETNLATQKELEKNLVRSEKLAALGRVASGMAHEIRNPLAAMKLKVQMAARNDYDKSKLEKTFSVLNEEITRLDNLISKMLDAGKQKILHLSPVVPTNLLQERIDFLKEKYLAQHIAIETDLHDANAEISGDSEKIKQLFDNLLLNALEAMPDGGRLKIKTLIANGKLIYEFADTGIGLSPEEKEKIFEPFFTTKEKGTGLGLAISREIAEAHGGRLFSGEAEKGAVFIIEFPLQTK